MKCDSWAHSWPAPLQAFALVANPRLGLQQRHLTLHTWGQRLPLVAMVDDPAQIGWKHASYHSKSLIQQTFE
jgi:hypothetical protein